MIRARKQRIASSRLASTCGRGSSQAMFGSARGVCSTHARPSNSSRSARWDVRSTCLCTHLACLREPGVQPQYEVPTADDGREHRRLMLDPHHGCGGRPHADGHARSRRSQPPTRRSRSGLTLRLSDVCRRGRAGGVPSRSERGFTECDRYRSVGYARGEGSPAVRRPTGARVSFGALRYAYPLFHVDLRVQKV